MIFTIICRQERHKMYITDDIRYIGVNDHKIDLFEGQYTVENGMSYNSYAIIDYKIAIMDTVDSKTQSYAPEIVFTCKYFADEKGDAHTMQVLPDGYAYYVCHRPEELPLGIRWISRTEDEDAMGMVLPSTAEHLGYKYCKKMGYEQYLKKGESVTYHMTTGILAPDAAEAMKNKILELNK